MSQLMTVKELATLMGWVEHTVYQRRYRGDSMPRSINVGGGIRFRRDEVERWLDEHTDQEGRGRVTTQTRGTAAP
jgi:excisionase family DNA binding protein